MISKQIKPLLPTSSRRVATAKDTFEGGIQYA